MKPHQGFSLMELLIAVAIVGILATIAYPAYQDSVMRSRRADAKIALTQAAAQQEKRFTETSSYTSNMAEIGGATSPESFYNLAVAVTNGGLGFTLTATPAAGSPQANDNSCAQYQLTHTGAKLAFDAGATTSVNCW
ncbi:MAG: type IV pilin protein [Pseudomonadota bacterium]|nr:type IV pilin protein [Pseudomonadota bacterium]